MDSPGHREPPEPVDDWVAVLLVERYLRGFPRDASEGALRDRAD